MVWSAWLDRALFICNVRMVEHHVANEETKVKINRDCVLEGDDGEEGDKILLERSSALFNKSDAFGGTSIHASR